MTHTERLSAIIEEQSKLIAELTQENDRLRKERDIWLNQAKAVK